jgi:peptidoglycan L-alanyl-D-glutamate endopeptidase CwlK
MKFSASSQSKLETCHPDLQKLFSEVIKHYDCTVVCGHRSEAEQEEARRKGNSKLSYPNSKHNQTPSLAVDVLPYPFKSWEDTNRFHHFAGFVLATAVQLGIKIRWGGDFNSDLNFKNDSFVDMPHFELVGDIK